MANQQMESCLESEESIFEEKVDLEDLILSQTQVQKVDENLTVEFSDIKKEPINHFEINQKYGQTQVIDSPTCISFDTSEYSGQLATIHMTCFKEMLEKLNKATEKINNMEMKNKELLSNASNLQSTISSIKNEHKSVLSINAQRMSEIVKKHERENKQLCEKLSSARKEIRESAKEREKMMHENEKYIHFHGLMELELQKSKLKNDQLSFDMEKLKDELKTLMSPKGGFCRPSKCRDSNGIKNKQV